MARTPPQKRRMWRDTLLALVGSLVLFVAILAGDGSAFASPWVWAGFGLAAFGALDACFGIRCRACRYPLGRHTSAWAPWRHCPRCGVELDGAADGGRGGR